MSSIACIQFNEFNLQTCMPQARNAKRHGKRTMAMMMCLSAKEKEQYDGAGRNNCTHSDQTSWTMTELCLACQSSAKNESMPRKHFTHKRSMPNFWKFGERRGGVTGMCDHLIWSPICVLASVCLAFLHAGKPSTKKRTSRYTPFWAYRVGQSTHNL